MRTLRLHRTARTSALATAAVLAALSLTACGGGDSSAAGTPAPVSDAPSPQPANDAKAPAEQGKDAAGSTTSPDAASVPDAASAKNSGKNSGSTHAEPAANTSKGTDSGVVTLACHGGNSKVTLKPVTRPVNHMLLTVTNTGSKSCNAYGYPAVRFGEAQSVPPAYEESKPQAVVTLAPGESAYAGVMTNSADGSGTNGYSTKSLTVYFQGRDLSGSTGQGANVPLSEKVYVDSTLTVTYWQADMADALMY
ncbi:MULTISPECIES: DUF4232 domain-containing protein [Streptomyces]|uniref:DUF4232 domain-containing protein n=1 Tax=Streptomyces TaxID=1883 RepID=UPI00081B097E|nr:MULTISPECIES: DUF4232 domain-containing protein [unclassified Streptomyces]MYQ55479.1 DUF4232 domain-containing protein [Streptomyces sp. SID4941]SCE38572.1 Protein of unknown function [Streptomyces sp. PalvLS-984]SDE16219.1 Protein of unknown function [Streptomyces sp. AmelKG-A3]